MSTLRRTMATTAAGLMFGAITLGAQAVSRVQRHHGFNIGFGIGAADYDLKCSGCTTTGASDPWEGGFGSSGYLRIGGAVSQQLLLGGEVSGAGIAGPNERNSSIGQLLFTAQYYPGAFEGFHVIGAMGPAAISLQNTESISVNAVGYALRAGVGYDFGLGKRFALTPYASIGRTMISQGSIETAGATGTVTRVESKRLVQFGLGVNWY